MQFIVITIRFEFDSIFFTDYNYVPQLTSLPNKIIDRTEKFVLPILFICKNNDKTEVKKIVSNFVANLSQNIELDL